MASLVLARLNKEHEEQTEDIEIITTHSTLKMPGMHTPSCSLTPSPSFFAKFQQLCKIALIITKSTPHAKQ